MNRVVRQEFQKFLELYHSVVGQRLLTNVDTAEQQWLEYSQDQYVQKQWKWDFRVERSEVYQGNFWRKHLELFQRILISQRANCTCSFQNAEQLD